MDRHRIHALLAALGLGLCLSTGAMAAAPPWTEMSQIEAERAIDASLHADAAGSIAGAIRTQLPKDYPGLLRRTAAALRGGIEGEAYYWQTRLELDRLHVAHKGDLAAAPSVDLMALARAEATYVRALQANGPAVCAQYLSDGSTLIGAPAQDTAAETALEAADLARIEAIRAGLNTPKRREPAVDADFEAWGAAMAQHEGQKLALQYLDEKWLRQAGQRDVCAALVAFYDGVLALPPESGAKVFLSLYGDWRDRASPAVNAPDVATEAEARRVVEGWAVGTGDHSLDAALKSTLPEEYGDFVDRMVPLVLAGIDKDEVERRKYQFFMPLTQVHLDDVKAAPIDALQDWARAQRAYFLSSRSDGPDACAVSVSGVDVDPARSRASDRSLSALFETVIARWRLIRAGRDRPTPRADASAADREAWDAGIAKRLGAKGAANLRDVAWRRSATNKALCAADVEAFEALMEIPAANAAPLMALSAVGFSIYKADPVRGASQANAEKAFEEAVDALPRADFAKALKANLPDDYRSYLSEVAEVARKGGSNEQVSAKAEATLAAVEARRQNDLMAAPAPLLASFFAKQTAFLRILHEEDTARCASFFFQSDSDSKPPSARAAQAASEAYAAEFKAIRAGMDKPAFRQAATDAEMEDWAEAFAGGVPARTYQAYVTDPELADASDQDRCAVSIALYAALSSLSDENAAKVFKTLNAEEDGQASPSVASLSATGGPATL